MLVKNHAILIGNYDDIRIILIDKGIDTLLVD